MEKKTQKPAAEKKQQAAAEKTPAAAKPKKTPAAAPTAKQPGLFIATQSAMGAVSVLRGEIAVEGANILRTHGHLFKPLQITYTV